jgi:hypothetical protein
MTRTRLQPSRIVETRGSPIRTRNHHPLKHITNDSNPVKEPETTPIGTENTAFTARSRTTPKKNAERESMKKKTCRDKQGCAYWPKVYMISNVDQNERDQQGQQ